MWCNGDNGPAPVNIPADELGKLMHGVTEAFHAAGRGEVRPGYRVLCDGLFRARELEAPWAGDVTQLWAVALAHFIKRYPTSWFGNDL